jgi:hypothetical protein
MPASIAGDTWPDVFATTYAVSERPVFVAAPQELGLHENVLLGRRNILMVSTRCAEAPVRFTQSSLAVTSISKTHRNWGCFGGPRCTCRISSTVSTGSSPSTRRRLASVPLDDRHGALLDADMTADALILMEHQLKHGETGAPRSWTSTW